MKTLAIFVGLLAMSANAAPFTFGAAKVNSLSVENSRKKQITVEMDLSDAYAVIRVDKKAGKLATAKVTAESLAYCKVIGVNQSRDTIIADAIVSFEVENDGGYNSCTVTLDNGSRSMEIELGAEVGE